MNAETPSLSPEVKEFNGTPTLFLNGKPEFWTCLWGRQPDEHTRRTAEQAGIHIYTPQTGCLDHWCGPGEGHSGHFDFSSLKQTLDDFVDSDPRALFYVWITLEMKAEWWQQVYPEECEITNEGRRPEQSNASIVWREEAKSFIRALVAHLERIGYSDRVIGYNMAPGTAGEWGKASSSMGSPCGDFSEPMRRHFRACLREKYGEDVAALRTAWADPEVTFDTAEVPAAEKQLATTHFIFREPSREQDVIDYYQCLAELYADLLIDFCQTAKEASGGRAITGTFYGYLMEMSWNDSFFGQRADRWWEGEYSALQRSGHMGLGKVLESPYVDLLISPNSYGFRKWGGDAPSMNLVESARLHGKLVIIESDTRRHDSHGSDPSDTRHGRCDNLQETTTICRRNLAQMATHGEGVWCHAMTDPELLPVFKKLREIGTFALQTDRTPSAEIAVLLDDESFYYETIKNNLDVPLVFHQKLQGLVRTGAPFDLYLLDDFLAGRLPPYRLYLFLNAFRLDRTRRQALKREVQRDGRVAVWMYAPGYIQDDLSTDHMTDLTGFRFAAIQYPWYPFMNIVDFTHPITAGIPQDLFWGASNLISPLFYLDDPDARILGQVVHAEGRCVPGMGVKAYPEWTSVFISTPNVPAPVLRGMARLSGVHLYSEAGDVLYASRQLLGIHTVSGGERVYKLPHQVEEVYDLYEDCTVAREAAEFQVTLPPKSSALYYTGPAGLLARSKQ